MGISNEQFKSWLFYYLMTLIHQEGITACEEALNSRANLSPPTDNFCHLMKLILSTNAFTFNKEYYLQVLGTAMGTCMVPSYANLFMGKLEREFLRTQDKVPLVWWRYTDDISAMWTYGKELLYLFMENLNSYHTMIKFKATWSSEEIMFLDTRVYIKNDRFETNQHVKPTDTHHYLQANSCHPRHCTTVIPFGQTLRLRRIWSKKDNLQKRC